MAFKLGKLAPQFDARDLPMRALLKPTLAFPSSYDFDALHPGLPYPMFANDQLGCCVISGRAHQTLRFEAVEQQKVIPITDQEVINEYFRQTGGIDSGLVVSRSLRSWRQKGWIAAGTRYYSKGYARVNHKVADEVRTGIYADVGVGIGFLVPRYAMDQIDKGLDWTIPINRTPAGDQILDGHYVYLPAYHDDGGFTCVTWGQRQKMSSAFFAEYVDEAWAVFDAANPTAKQSALIDFAKMESFVDGLRVV